MKSKVYDIVLQKLIAEMESGIIPWHKPWMSIPKQNLKSKKAYRGINRLLLSSTNEEFFISYKQLSDLGGSVNKGAKANMVIFWKPIEVNKSSTGSDQADEAIEKETAFVLRYYRVFGLNDVSGIKRPEIVKNKDNDKKEDIEAFLKKIGPAVNTLGSRACYCPGDDAITMPEIKRFDDTDHYYCTMLHELIHWTGAAHRLARIGKETFNYNVEYGKEELTAEIGAAILCHRFGISLPKHNAGYLQSWLKTIKGDNRILFSAASRAEKAIEYLDAIALNEKQQLLAI